MKKKAKKGNIFERYGLDIPDEVVTEAEFLIDHDTRKRQSLTIECLEKEVKELKKYQKLWEMFKKVEIDFDLDAVCGIITYKEVIEHTFDNIEEYVEFMEHKFLEEKEEDKS